MADATQPTWIAAAAAPTPADAAAYFRNDLAVKSGQELLAVLTRQEREQIYQLVETDVEAAYRQRFAEAARQQELLVQQQLQELAAGLARVQRESIDELARGTADLALALAERLVRARIALDPGVLVRSLESLLHRLAGEVDVTVTVHPDEAAALRARRDLLEALHVGEVREDRRVEPGGCLVQAGRRAWDATVASQLEALGETVRANLIAVPDSGEPGGDHGPVALD